MDPSTTSALAAPLLETKVATAVPNNTGNVDGSDDSDDGPTPFPPYVEREESLYDTSSIDDDNESFQTTSGGPVLADSIFSTSSAEPAGSVAPVGVLRSSASPEPAGKTAPPETTQIPRDGPPLAAAAETMTTIVALSPHPPPPSSILQLQPPSSSSSSSPPPVTESQPPPYWMHTRPATATNTSMNPPSTALPPPLPPRPSGPPLPPRRSAGSALSPFRVPWPTSFAVPFNPLHSLGPFSTFSPFSPFKTTPKTEAHQAGQNEAEAAAATAWSHYRDNSTSSADLITLQDNEAQEEADAAARYGSNAHYGYHGSGGPGSSGSGLNGLTTTTSRCWARRVDLTEFVVVGGRGGAATTKGAVAASAAAHSLGGSFVVWTVRVQTLQGGAPLLVHKRYSEFDTLRRQLVASFPTACAAAVPPLPPKTVLHNFQPEFLEQRRLGLQYFLNCILLNPEFSGSPVLKEFLFS